MTDQIFSSQVISRRWQLARFLSVLIEPSPAIIELPRRRRARMLSALLIITLLLAVISLFLTILDVNPIPKQVNENLVLIDLLAMLGLLGSYGLSRTRFSGAAAIITVVVILLAVFMAVFANPGVGMVLPYITLGVLMGGMFLPPRTTILIFVITVTIISALPLAIPGYPVSDLFVAGFFVLIVKIEAQSGALLEREASLQEAVQKAQDANRELSSRVDELKQLSAEVSLLSKMSQMLQACQNDAEAKAVIGQFAPQLFPATTGAVYLINASRTYIESIAAWGEASAPLSERIFGPNECWALRRGRAHLVQDQASDLACQHVETNARAAFPSLCVPLMAQGEALGLLHLESEQVSVSLTESQQLLAQSVSEDLS
ncbi:MAG: GAF domain-containing protein, partial [Chloroflexi bacterium]|nr:GAF domain-containing protein [Chloroflexota bacterium]